MRRLARILFPYYWETLSFGAAVGVWTLACWTWGLPDGLAAHAVALAILFAVVRVAAEGYSREVTAAPVSHRLGMLTLAAGFAGACGAAGLVAAAVVWMVAVRAGGMAAQAGTVVPMPFEWLGSEFRVAGWTGILAAVALTVDGYLRGYRALEVTRLGVTLPGLPAALDGFRLVQLSDLHLGPIASRSALREAFDRALAEDPDLIVVTGDIVDSPTTDVDAWMPELPRLRARHGVVAILGNHDVEAGIDRVAAALGAATDWVVLRDRVHRVAETLHVAGLEYRPTPSEGDGVAAVWSAVPAGAPAILLAHHPNAFPAARAAGVPLTLAGHTHGGQVALPFAPWLNAARALMTSYDAGTFDEDGCMLHVNRGLGTSGQRVRIGAPREITVVTLRAPDAA